MINFKPILERIATAYDFQNPEELFLPPQTQPGAAPTQEQIDQQNQQQPQQGGPDQQQFYNIRGADIGEQGQRTRYLQQGGIPMDPQLAAALGRIRGF